jgi:N-acetylglucosaminyldiphosphoundecaprenol N-acetyl-beta-D-mannosaminyltransferase
VVNRRRIDILGVPVDCVTMSGTLDVVEEMLRGDRAQAVAAVNPEKVIRARREPLLMQSLQRTALLIPDGIGIVLAARLLNLGRMDRVPGSELMPEICRLAARKGFGIFLFGGSSEINRQTERVLRTRYPGIRIVGREHGYHPEDAMPQIIQRINASGADILFIALGTPKQEFWIDRHLPELRIKVCQGVGGTFDVIAGRVKRAPLLFRKMHLEWFYRLTSQPKRMLRQTALPQFAFQVLRKRVSG